MGSLLHCLLRSCFEEENESQQHNRTYEPPTASRMVRSAQYESTAQGEQEEESEDNDGDCCRPDPDRENEGGLNDFWRNLRDRWRRYESLEPVEAGEARSSRAVHPTDVPFQRSAPFGIFRRSNSAGKAEESPSLLSLSRSPLRTASSFRHSKGLPSIDPEEVVLPGSALQQEMAASLSGKLEEQGDECVICMEGFDAHNPRMPTLCGCGENKTYFHLPCLYQWIEQSRNCPSCRKRLRWEEF